MTIQNTLQPDWTSPKPGSNRTKTSDASTPEHALVPTGRTTRRRHKPVLPGFGLSLGVSVLFISLVILFPLSALFVFISDMGMAQFWSAVSDPRVVAAYRVTLSAAFWSTAAALVIGTLLAWVLARYDFPG